ncbi:hypothetical protein G6F57_012002 [Rhizopus arrhizus]|uniref:Uncharacterized protein n=1 Tax=Rhizopus oryzae TaxID=64495 RepID=A0A9P6WZ51_RHIOR|nr:hypothetical protein G6F30_011003 [Rhizopus arrhizus]KAG1401881.1 hypothetical protein G6F58_010662 [Rhizopus delemar]KAG0976140.1 hypothetical protein G6F29_011015 [Rhizopus arrhizus]KAG0980209.1 hypothetical protein G6F28_011711 [Rhizopus arrhizus]KAG1003504.1 hypothetical protein G6F27_010990 [Rhizopus arrhizus]
MYKSLQTVGFIHSGLSSTLLNVDRPTRNITRITRQEPIVISYAIEHFGETVPPAMVSVWIATDIVKNIFDILNVPPPPANDENEGDFSWIRDFFKKQRLSGRRTPFSTLNNHQSP